MGVACLFLTGCRHACEHVFRARPRAELWVRFTELGKHPSCLHDVRRMARAGTLFGSFTLAYRFTTTASSPARERLDRVLPDFFCQFLDRIRWLRRSGSGWQPFFAVNLRKPSNAWQWLALLSPATVIVIFGTALPGWLNALLGHGYDTFGTQTGVGVEGLLVGTAMSFILGFWWARDGEESFIGRCVTALRYGIVIEFINLFVAFAGCTGVAVLGRAISR